MAHDLRDATSISTLSGSGFKAHPRSPSMTPGLAPRAPTVQGWAAVSRFGTAAHQVIFCSSEFIRASLAKQKMFQVSLER